MKVLKVPNRIGFGKKYSHSRATKVFEGKIIHALDFNRLEIVADGRVGLCTFLSLILLLAGIDEKGEILFLDKSKSDFQKSEQQFGYDQSKVSSLGNKILIPGFIDTHTHAPQYVFTGTGTGLPLMEWLDKYTFKHESKFKDVDFAEMVYSKGNAFITFPLSFMLNVRCQETS
jgi:guanine deaminase